MINKLFGRKKLFKATPEDMAFPRKDKPINCRLNIEDIIDDIDKAVSTKTDIHINGDICVKGTLTPQRKHQPKKYPVICNNCNRVFKEIAPQDMGFVTHNDSYMKDHQTQANRTYRPTKETHCHMCKDSNNE